jgi:hypothetical protein
MNELEARVRCLELSAQLNKALGDHSAEGIVKIATILYAFTQSPQEEEILSVSADKPRRGRPPSPRIL